MRVALLIVTLLFSLYVGHSIDKINTKARVHFNSCKLAACSTVKVRPTDRPIPTAVPTSAPARVWVGKVSHYSVEGCLGCSPTLRMANGETLRDDRLTIAFNRLPLNTMVRVTNLNNGRSVEALVTDTGGFEKLGRIADLTPAVALYLETKTDVSNVKIEAL